MGEPIIEVEHITKTFKISQRSKGLTGHIANLLAPKYISKKAVNDISFTVDHGETVGFIGANGAGKSTTIKMLSGILYPDDGSIHVSGYIPYNQRKEYVKNIGVVFGQKSQLTWDLPVIDSFELLKHIYNIESSTYQKNLDNFTDLLGMGEFINQPVRQLSLGQRMRCDIAAALLHSPKIVFFDEPTIGLDVVAKEKIREFIKYINKEQGVTMIFTTHDMQDIVKTCEKLIMINKGEKIYDGGVKELREKYGQEKILSVEFDQEYDIDEISGARIVNKSRNVKHFIINNNSVSATTVLQQIMSKYTVIDVTIIESDFESIVRNIYEGGLND